MLFRSTCALLLFFSVAIPRAAGDTATRPSANDPDAAALSAACDELLKSAVHRPYGIGWAEKVVLPGDLEPVKPLPVVSFEPRQTPAAGLMLWWAGKVLHEPRFMQGAIDVARAIAMSQQPNGKIPNSTPFGMTADRGQDQQAIFPDRRSTEASLGLLLTILADSDQPNQRLRACAMRAAGWIERQQAGGGWPTAYSADATPEHADHLFRLDQPDWRDSALSLLLTANVLADNTSALAAKKACQTLIALRISDNEPLGVGDWSAVYRMDQVPRRDIPALPFALDTVATRYSMQSLLADALCTGDDAVLQPLQLAATSLNAVKRADGRWERRYSFGGPQTSTRPTAGVFDRAPVVDPCPPGLAELVSRIGDLNTMGLPAFTKIADQGLGTRRQIAEILCGLSDDLLDRLPARQSDPNGLLANHQEPLRAPRAFDGDIPSYTDYLHLLLMRIEARTAAGSTELSKDRQVR